MTLSDLASLGSFVSGVAVLISLIYLALQVRQTQRNQQSLMQEARTSRLVDTAMRIADSSLAAVMAKALSGGGEITDVERVQLAQIIHSLLRTGEETFLQHRAGALSAAAVETSRRNWKALVSHPRIRATWLELMPLFDTEFAKEWDAAANETPLLVRRRSIEEFNQLVAELTGRI